MTLKEKTVTIKIIKTCIDQQVNLRRVMILGLTNWRVRRIICLEIGSVFWIKQKGKTFKSYWLRVAPTGLTFNNCTLCPHFIYVFFIYLRTNSDLCHLQHKLIGFITEMKSVYSTVRTGSLNKTYWSRDAPTV